MTGSELIRLVRTLVHEAIEKFWGDSEIIDMLNLHLKTKAMMLANSNANFYWYQLTHTIVTQSNIFQLPDGILYNNAPKISPVGLESLFINDSELPIPDGDFRFFTRNNSGSPSEMTIRGNNIYFDGLLKINDIITLQYWYVPNKITEANREEEVDFPDSYAGILAYEAAIMCVIKDEGDIVDLERKRILIENEMKNNLQRRIRTNTIQVPEVYIGE